eukprot:scaffold1697_cov180-Amphora_coffeaeformis.AAC.41
MLLVGGDAWCYLPKEQCHEEVKRLVIIRVVKLQPDHGARQIMAGLDRVILLYIVFIIPEGEMNQSTVPLGFGLISRRDGLTITTMPFDPLAVDLFYIVFLVSLLIMVYLSLIQECLGKLREATRRPLFHELVKSKEPREDLEKSWIEVSVIERNA